MRHPLCLLGIHLLLVETYTRKLGSRRQYEILTFNRCLRPSCKFHQWMLVDREIR